MRTLEAIEDSVKRHTCLLILTGVVESSVSPAPVVGTSLSWTSRHKAMVTLSGPDGGNRTMNDRARKATALLVALLVCYAAAAVGGLLGTGSDQNWYADLAKPSWTPPAWVFGPVWMVLYGMMAVAVWLVWLRRSRQPGAAPLVVFAVHLAFNAAWSPLFFGLHRPGMALVDIVLLWLTLAVTMWLFLRRRAVAGLLLVPYLLWVSFAAALNFAIWRLNV